MTSIFCRRNFLRGAAAVSLTRARPAFAGAGHSVARSLSFENIHTGEKLAVEYWAQGRYVPEALAEVNHLLRDFRSGEVRDIAPQLLDLLVALRTRLDTIAPIAVISGYRSPATNALLRGENGHSGVAAKSLHMVGKAIDIRIPGRPLKALQEIALAQRAGGVGYYPQSDFVHVDVGAVRRW